MIKCSIDLWRTHKNRAAASLLKHLQVNGTSGIGCREVKSSPRHGPPQLGKPCRT
jgi:hypothetical protein